MSSRDLTCVDCGTDWAPAASQPRDVRCPGCRRSRAARDELADLCRDLVRDEHGIRLAFAALEAARIAHGVDPNRAGPAHLASAIHDVSRNRQVSETETATSLLGVAAASQLWAAELNRPVNA